MRSHVAESIWMSVLAAAVFGCSESTAPTNTVPLTTAPDFSGLVTKAETQNFNAPSGYYVSQRVAWVAIAPANRANAGVIIGRNVAVFIRLPSGEMIKSNFGAVMPNEAVQVWHDRSTAYGAVEAPPGSPAYSAVQVVIMSPLIDRGF